jgi:hypothetical protein
MKPLTSVIFLTLVSASGCATDTVVKHVKHDVQPSMRSMHTEKKGICADAKAPPLNQCAETISAAFDSKGVLWIAWVNNDHIYVQSSLDKGISFSDPVQVNALPEPVVAHTENRPKIKVDGQGIIYLTWTNKLEQRFSGNIRFSRSTDGGQHFSEPVTVNDNLDIISHRFDSLAIGKNGEIFIAWLDARDVEAAKKAGLAFEGSSLYYAWSDDGGQHFHPNKRIAAHTCQCCRLDTAINKDNLPVIIWRHVFEGGIRDHAINRFSDWNTPGDVNRLSHDDWKIDACPHHGPGLAITDNDSYHAVWFTNAPTKQGLFYAHSKDAGHHFSEPLNFGNAGASHPHVVALGDQVKIVWQEFDGSNNLIQLIKSADAGKTWTPPEVIARTTATVDNPFLVSDGKAMYLSWKIQQQTYNLQAIED